jgi:hypothetical protein
VLAPLVRPGAPEVSEGVPVAVPDVVPEGTVEVVRDGVVVGVVVRVGVGVPVLVGAGWPPPCCWVPEVGLVLPAVAGGLGRTVR